MFSTKRILRMGTGCLAAISLLLSGCRAVQPTAAPAPSVPPSTPTAVAAANPSPQPTPTAAKKSLVICLGQEPTTLYLYGPGSPAQWSVLESVYDGPIDIQDY